MKQVNVGILGATGAVGQEMIKILEERNFPVASLRPIASARSAGSKIMFRGQEVVAVALVGDKTAVHEIRSVGNVDAVRLNGQRRRIRLQLDAGEQVCNRLG